MKKIAIALMLCIISIACFAQKKIGTYTSSYFDHSYDVEYSTKTKDYYIQIQGLMPSQKIYFILESSKVDEFRKALADAKEKYEEWSKVAKENNVSKFRKKMDISFPNGSVAWLGSEWRFCLYAKPKPSFVVTNDGLCTLSLFSDNKFAASDNQYITVEAYWAFGSADDIEELDSLLDESIINKLKENEAKTEDLFH